jgi:hypothetical protein
MGNPSSNCLLDQFETAFYGELGRQAAQAVAEASYEEASILVNLAYNCKEYGGLIYLLNDLARDAKLATAITTMEGPHDDE